VSLDTLIARSDIASLHVPFIPETRNIIPVEVIARMWKNALLINVSRAGWLRKRRLPQRWKAAIWPGRGETRHTCLRAARTICCLRCRTSFCRSMRPIILSRSMTKCATRLSRMSLPS
jgi:hypothetical protein